MSTRTTDSDPEDQFVWSSRSSNWNSEGIRTKLQVIFDDGRSLEKFFHEGTPYLQVIQDGGDVMPWTSVTKSFSETGQQLSRVVKLDNGLEVKILLSDGAPVSKVITDRMDGNPWNSITLSLDGNRKILQRVIDYDDGKLQIENRTDGLPVSRVMSDAEDVERWDTIEYGFDAEGRVTSRTTIFDDESELLVSVIHGTENADNLPGTEGEDDIRGFAGEDTIDGGLGRDFMRGGDDADTFVFDSIDDSGATKGTSDRILDFEQGVDTIDLSDMIPETFTFIGTANFTGANQVRVQETAGGLSIVEINVDADLAADSAIRLPDVSGLTSDDFIL